MSFQETNERPIGKPSAARFAAPSKAVDAVAAQAVSPSMGGNIRSLTAFKVMLKGRSLRPYS
jgi:hypothetical protein